MPPLFQQDYSHMKLAENHMRLTIVISLIVGALALMIFFHGFTASGAVVTHLFYIPIILSTLWWKQRGLITPILMAVILIVSHWFFLPGRPFTNDSLRIVMFIGVGFIVARLSTQIFQVETELRRHRDYLEEMVVQRTAQLTAVNEQLSNEINIRKSTERTLRESEARYRLLVETSRNIVIMSDSSGDIRYMNPEGLNAGGYSGHDISAKAVSDVLTSDDYASIVHPPAPDEQKTPPVLYEAQFLTKAGAVIPVEVSSAVIDDRHTSGVMITARDVTLRKQIEANRKKIEKLEAIGILAGGIAHDFNNILMAVMGNVSVAKLHITGDGRLSPLLSAIETATRQAADLTQQFLVFSPGGKPVTKRHSIAGLLGEVAGALPGNAAVSIRLNIAENADDIEVDAQLIRHAINNIITNAVEAMSSGGELMITAENVQVSIEPHSPDLPSAPGAYVRIALKDTGKGIPEALLPRVFDPYVTTKPMGTQKGSGLGLTIVHAIVQKHHGHIQMESSPEHGTTVTLYLPVAPASAAFPENLPSSEKRRVLLMDDELMIREITGEMLRHIGYDVACAESGEQAVKRFQEALDAGSPFDAVLLDIHVQEGDGGIETLQHLKAIDKNVKAIASSGYSVDSVITDYRSFGFTGCLAKPYRLEELQNALQLAITC